MSFNNCGTDSRSWSAIKYELTPGQAVGVWVGSVLGWDDECEEWGIKKQKYEKK